MVAYSTVEESGGVLGVYRLALDPGRSPPGEGIFRLADYPGYLVCTPAFRESATRLGLTGVEFAPVFTPRPSSDRGAPAA